jgi:hypothetical protein
MLSWQDTRSTTGTTRRKTKYLNFKRSGKKKVFGEVRLSIPYELRSEQGRRDFADE